jgi:hypothetical protein
MANGKGLGFVLAAAAACGIVYFATRNSPTTWSQEYGCLINNFSSGTTPNNGPATVWAGLASLCP